MIYSLIREESCLFIWVLNPEVSHEPIFARVLCSEVDIFDQISLIGIYSPYTQLSVNASENTGLRRPRDNIESIRSSGQASRAAAMHQAICCQNRDGDIATASQDHLHELYKLLIAPVEQALPVDEDRVVTVIPHGTLFAVPFTALKVNQAPCEYLVQRHAISISMSVSHLVASSKRLAELTLSQRESQSISITYNPEYIKEHRGQGLLPIISSVQEANTVTSAVVGAGWKMQSVSGEQATIRNFQESAKASSVVHISTFCLIEEQELAWDKRAVLALSVEPGYPSLLTASAISSSVLPSTQLVVLSGQCAPIRGEASSSGFWAYCSAPIEGSLVFARGFNVAGVPAVILPMWRASSSSCNLFMQAFYESYLGDPAAPVAVHVRRAMRVLLGHPSYHTPFHWAAFMSVGAPHPYADQPCKTGELSVDVTGAI